MSYDEWKSAGYHVVKGSKSQLRDALGVPQFTLDQVEKNRPTMSLGQARANTRSSAFSGTQWEQSAARAEAKGTPWGVVEDFDSFVREAGMLPDLSGRPIFNITSPLEMHFMNVADKHGILDHVIDGDYDEY